MWYRNDIYIRRMPGAFRLQREAAKDSTVIYHTDQLGASGSYYIFFWSGVYNCIRFISAFCNLITSSPRSLMGNILATYEVQGSHPSVILFFFKFQF